MRYVSLFCLLLGLARWASAQSLTVAQADSLRHLLQTNRSDTNQVGALLRLSVYYQHRTLHYAHNLDTALNLVSQAQDLSRQLQYANGQQEALFQQGCIFIRQEQYGKAHRLLSSGNELIRIRLLLELGKNKLKPTYSQQAHLDSALLYFSQAEGLSRRLGSQPWQQESQMLTGVAYMFKGDCGRSEAWFKRVIQARQKAGDKVSELRAWLRWATTQNCVFKFCESSDSLGRALALAHQTGDQTREALLWLIVGLNYSLEGKQGQEERAALKALAIQRAIGYPAFNRAYHALLEENEYLQPMYLANLLDANGILADAANLANNLSKEVFYTLEVVKDLQRSGLHEDLDWPYFWLGNIFSNQKQYNKALAYYQQSLAVSQRKGLVPFAGLIRHTAQLLLWEGKARQALHLLEDFTRQHVPLSYTEKMSIALGFGQCYASLKQNKVAEQYYLEAETWATEQGESSLNTFYYHISEFYVNTAQYAKAAPYLKRMVAYTGLIQPDFKMQLYLLQFRVDSARANYPAALRHYQRYTALKDSLLNEKTTQQMAELDIRYQTGQKEQALKLRQKDIRLLTQQSKTQQTQRNALFGGTLLLTALLGLGYNRYRLKRRSNQLLQAQQQQIHHKNEDLQRLLKEIHHRVKNNLQVVTSLLDSHAASLQDQEALSAIRESQHRVQAMALIHQKLYQTKGVARIPMPDYIDELAAYLRESFDLPQSIRFDLQVEPIELDVTQAVPLGLILNEALTNALKYAFADSRPGTVRVRLGQVEGAGYELVIADDGVGLPSKYDPSRSRSLGMTLIRGFSKQLGGQLEIVSPPGLSMRLRFQDETNTFRL